MLDWIPYQTLKLMGWTTLILVVLSTLFHILLITNKYLSKQSSDRPWILRTKKLLRKILPTIRNYHPALGTAAVITGITHGYLLLRRVRLHSGFITWSFVLFMALSGLIMKFSSNKVLYKKLRKIHHYAMFALLAVMIFHVLQMQ